jgi:hypothetical protein
MSLLTTRFAELKPFTQEINHCHALGYRIAFESLLEVDGNFEVQRFELFGGFDGTRLWEAIDLALRHE